jgi:LacI family transcriptional regulator
LTWVFNASILAENVFENVFKGPGELIMHKSQVTIREVARRAGVSISSVSRVVNNNSPVSPAIREKVLRVIEEVGYRPDRSARALKRQKTSVIGAVIPDVSNPFFSLMVRGIENSARDNDYSVLICDTDNRLQAEAQYIDVLISERVDGVILTSTGRSNDRLGHLFDYNIPFIAADRRLKDRKVFTVATDGLRDSRMLTSHLIDLGYKDICFLAGPDHVSTAQERLDGFRGTLADAGLTGRVIRQRAGDYSFESGYRATGELCRGPRPDAIIAANDLMAIGSVKALEEAGLVVPDDIGVAGFDHIPLTEWMKPRLTTVEIPAYDLGRRAMELLLRIIRQEEIPEEGITVPTRLVEGESTRRLK